MTTYGRALEKASIMSFGADPADAAQATNEIEEAPIVEAIMERTYGNVGGAHLPRCRVCQFPLHPELDPIDDTYCSNTCKRREEKL